MTPRLTITTASRNEHNTFSTDRFFVWSREDRGVLDGNSQTDACVRTYFN
jgi:hypothetical protein